MKRDNKLVKFTTLVLMITIVAISLVSGTYAKYTSTVSGSDTAVVAKWDVSVGNIDEEKFDLFGASGVYDLSEVTNTDDLSEETGTIDEDVVNEGKKVAPGTWGKVTFDVSNNSDVTAKYIVDISSLSTILPLKFSTDGKIWVDAATIAAQTADGKYDLGEGTLAIGDEGTANLYWKWDFETNANDTELGTDGTATCAITAGVTFEQVD